MIGKLIKIPFLSTWEIKMNDGHKTCTSRTKRYGNVGDYFIIFGSEFILQKVEQRELSYIADVLYREEGCLNPEEFISVWEAIHPVKGWRPEQLVWVHFFKRVK